MKIAVAQIRPIKGKILENIEIHKNWIELAISENADFIAFPEMSLLGYEPKLAKKMAVGKNDLVLEQFQNISDTNSIGIGLGLPTKSEHGILISMAIFQPNTIRKIYSKQHLHPDEQKYFVEGNDQLILTIDNKKIALAICYESLVNEHSVKAHNLGGEIYLASVAKPQKGIEKAYKHYSKIAKEFSMPILMSNSIGFFDNFLSAGQSAIWNHNGELIDALDNQCEGILIYDSETNGTIKHVKVF